MTRGNLIHVPSEEPEPYLEVAEQAATKLMFIDEASVVAELWFDKEAGMVTFSGDADKAAVLFFDALKSYVDDYISKKLTQGGSVK